MKKIYLTILTVIFTMAVCFSQDTIVKMTNETIKGTVIGNTATEIKYKSIDNPNGPINSVPKSEVLMIRYGNGTKEIFNALPPPPESPQQNQSQFNNPAPQQNQVSQQNQPPPSNQPPPRSISKDELYAQGQSDASYYYRGYRTGANITSFVTLFLTPVIGLIPAIAFSSAPVKPKNMISPNPGMFSNINYFNGYADQARKIKSKSVWISYGYGVAVDALILFLGTR